MAKPVPFESHVEKLMHGFRSAMPQVAAICQFMPDDLLRSVIHELRMLHEHAQRELEKRGPNA